MKDTAHLRTEDLAVGYDGTAVMADIHLDIQHGEIFFIMGGSGSGKSTLLKTLVGLLPPVGGTVLYDGKRFVPEDPKGQAAVLRNAGVLFQGGALFSSLSLIENVALPLRIHTRKKEKEILHISSRKLAQVGLEGAGTKYPHEISGGMMKRAGLARALALDPDLLFFDEPSAGLDPLSSRHLDETIHRINSEQGSTAIIVSHELASIFTLADRAVFLDADSHRQLEVGDPKVMKTDSQHAGIRAFLSRGEPADPAPQA